MPESNNIIDKNDEVDKARREQNLINLEKSQRPSKLPEKLEKLKEAAMPLIKYLAENYHPHVQATVDSTSVSLWEGKMSIPKIYDFLVD